MIMEILKEIAAILLAILIVAVSVCFVTLCTGCVSKRYHRETFSIDPNGWIHYERIHGSIFGVASDTEFDSFETSRFKILKFQEKQDSIKLVVPPYGAIETNKQ
jgi:hypothetical protein